MSDVPPSQTEAAANAERIDQAVIDLQCRFMDLELLVAELNEVIMDLGEQLLQSERARRALSQRVSQLEHASAEGGGGYGGQRCGVDSLDAGSLIADRATVGSLGSPILSPGLDD